MIEIKTRCRIRIWVTFSCFLFSSLGFDERRLLYSPGYAYFVIIIIIYLSRHRNVANTPLSPTINKITKQKSWHWHTMLGESICVTETKRTSLTAGSRRGVYGDLTYTITATPSASQSCSFSTKPSESRRIYSATSNNMKLVHWPPMGGRLHLVQRGWNWVGCSPAQSPPHCTKCNHPPISGQWTS